MNYMKLKELMKKLFGLGILVTFLFACSQGGDSSSNSDDNASPETPGKYLVEATSLGEISASNLKQAAIDAGFPQALGDYMKYSIKLYKITYRTTYKGQSILASGIISCPIGTPDPISTLIVGSIQSYDDEDAPSEFKLPNHFSPFAAIASVGYLTLIPDMIGYGVSKDIIDIIFPMQNYQYSAGAMIDFIHAGDEFVKSGKIKVNGKKFMAGYSEGGYTAMAALKMIEEKPVTDISIEATAVGAGGYNLVGLLNKIIIIGDGTYSAPSHIASLLYSYNSVYEWGRPLADFFQEPYASKIPELLGGTYNREEIDSQLTFNLKNLLNPVFLDDLKNNKETDLINALAGNSVDNWAPKGKLLIYHNLYDEKVPFSDSFETYNKMISNGAQNVMFRSTEEVESHFDSGIAFMVIASIWFETLNQ